MATPSTIHREMLDAVGHHDLARFRGLLHAEYTYTGGDGKELSGPDAGAAVPEMYLAAFPDLAFEIKAVYTQGDLAIAEFVCRGTHTGELMGIAPTGRRVELNVCNVLEVRDGKAYREREYYDAMALMVQLGVATPPGKAVSSPA
jgi:predicted ester cyclase